MTTKTEPQLRKLSPRLLDPNPWNPNQQSGAMFLREKKSIESIGFKDPITVRPAKPRGRWQILDGEHRWKAAMELDLAEVLVLDVGPVDDTVARQITLAFNEIHGEPDKFKHARVVSDLVAALGVDSVAMVLPYSAMEIERELSTLSVAWETLDFAPPMRAHKEPDLVKVVFEYEADLATRVELAIKKRAETSGLDQNAVLLLLLEIEKTFQNDVSK